MVDVVQFTLRGSQQVADLGECIELIWTPAVKMVSTSWVFRQTGGRSRRHRISGFTRRRKQADSIIVNPVYPPEYKDFILVFPVESGVRPVYIVVSQYFGHHYYPKPTYLAGLPGRNNGPQAKTRVQGARCAPSSVGRIKKVTILRSGTSSTAQWRNTTNAENTWTSLITHQAIRQNPQTQRGR
jgi:hypothetical protein